MKIILNADDFGLTHEANLGIAKAFNEGFCSQASVVTNTNYFDEAVSLAEKNNFKHKVGLHINLFDGTPLTSGIKKLKQYARSDLFDYHPDFLHRVTPMYADVIAEEIEAQIQKYLSGGFSLMNIDSHHCAFYDIPVLYGLIPLLKKYKFESVRYIGNSFFNGSKWRHFYGTQWKKKMNQLHLRHTDYSSSVATFDKNRKSRNPQLMKEKKAEVYVHPVFVEGYFIDNYTGGTHLEDSFKKAKLDKMKFITSRDL